MYSLVKALLFLVTLRYKQVNLPNHIRTNYGPDASKQFWRYGDCTWKLRKAQLDYDFLTRCKTFKVFPKFVRFKLYKRSLHTTDFYKSWQSKLLSKEMTARKNAVSQLSKQRDELEQRIRERFSLFTYVLIVRFFRQRTDAQAEKTRAVHQKKLTTMGAGNQLLPCDPNKTVLSITSSRTATLNFFLSKMSGVFYTESSLLMTGQNLILIVT